MGEAVTQENAPPPNADYVLRITHHTCSAGSGEPKLDECRVPRAFHVPLGRQSTRQGVAAAVSAARIQWDLPTGLTGARFPSVLNLPTERSYLKTPPSSDTINAGGGQADLRAGAESRRRRQAKNALGVYALLPRSCSTFRHCPYSEWRDRSGRP